MFKNNLAEKLGLVKTLPAYMNPYLKPEDLLKGVTFASGGTGYDPLTAKIMVQYILFFSITILSFFMGNSFFLHLCLFL